MNHTLFAMGVFVLPRNPVSTSLRTRPVRPQSAGRAREATAAFVATYAQRAGIEGTLSRGSGGAACGPRDQLPASGRVINRSASCEDPPLARLITHVESAPDPAADGVAPPTLHAHRSCRPAAPPRCGEYAPRGPPGSPECDPP